jgi:hypothetical protein
MTEQDGELTFCRWHPETETGLSCYQCGAPICGKCAKRTPVGYICPDCRKVSRNRFEHARNYDYVIAAVISVVLGAIASFIPMIPMSGWFIFFLSPLAGTIIASVVWHAVGRRYSRHLWWIVTVGIIIGSAPLLLIEAFGGIGVFFGGNAFGIFDVFYALIHLPLVIGAAMVRLRLH